MHDYRDWSDGAAAQPAGGAAALQRLLLLFNEENVFCNLNDVIKAKLEKQQIYDRSSEMNLSASIGESDWCVVFGF